MPHVDAAEEALAKADEAYARFDVDTLIAHLSTAVRGFTESGRPCQAAMACVRLGDLLSNGLGHLTAGRAWYVRARRLLEDQPECIEQGWAAVAAMGCDVDDPDELLAGAELALARARTFGEVTLETKALADAGLAHVQAGRLVHGMALLDEAMALACGPVDDEDIVAKSVCSFFTACYYAADFERVEQWSDLLRCKGLLGPRALGTAFLSSHCDSVQATLLMELGRWSEAEQVLIAAKQRFEALTPIPAWHPDIALADLRVRQGRLAEAESLLVGKDQSMQALLPAVRLHVARRDAGLARLAAHRGIRALAHDRLRAAELLIALVDAELLAADLGAAERATDELFERLADVSVAPLVARAHLARARVHGARGSWLDAAASLESGLAVLAPTQLEAVRVALLVEMVGTHLSLGEGDAALSEARRTLALVERLDVVLDPASRDLLMRAGSGAPQTPGDEGDGPTTRVAVLASEGRGFVVSCDGTTARLRRSKGLQYLAELIACPGVERHVFDLVDVVEGVDESRLVDRRQLGEAGPMSDATARAGYRRQVESLRAEADDAIARGELDRAIELETELDVLVAHLAAAFGLGGAERAASSAAERARLNVTRSLRTAVRSVSEMLPGPGAALDRAIRTGRFCVFDPSADEAVRWVVHS
ncbi:MAG: hypothetical protein ACXIVQ_10355 [Acidimicrobiales bacterium]